MPQTYSPAVLIVDDDSGVTKYLREQFHEQTSVGVLVANDLGEAKELIDNKELSIDAILADLFFEKAKMAPGLDLYDGIDILHYSKQRRNGVRKYVLSFWADRDKEHDKVEELQLDIVEWLHKMFYTNSSDPKTPWAILERDLIKIRFQEIREQALNLGVDLPGDSEAATEFVRNLRPPRRTFIQSTDRDPYVIKKPIEVICIWDEDGQFRSHPRKIGLFQEGIGETVEESIADLASIIIDQYADFEVERGDRVRDYAQVVKDQLGAYVARKTRDEQ
jgi:CheY-like chemotaxis protein